MAQVPDSPENEAACLCKNCPSKVDDGMHFYCARGASPAVITRGFCACRWCPLWSGFGLSGDFYCDRNPAGGEEGVGAASLAGDEEVT
ncbi:MAG: DUF2769 domain-containing protein [Thermoleophilia bacterium]|nr:DUF2769 domain-containing protein [Thermoleophilia bacterium]